MPQSAESGLVRSIRKWDLIAVTINSVIGAGIFGLPSKVYGFVGSYSLPAVLLCAVFAAMIVLCFAEVASRFTDTGGPYLYTRKAFGPTAGFTVGWLMWIARITAFAANTSVMLSYVGLFWPAVLGGPIRAGVICAITVVIAIINLIGVRDVAMTTNILTIGKLAPLVLLIVTGLFFLDLKAFSFGSIPPPASFSSAMLLLAYAYTGFEIAVIPAAEMKDPRRDLPVAILTTIALVAVLYILIQIVCIGTLPGLAASDRPLADAAQRFLGKLGATIMSAGAVISVAANLNVVMLSASRLPFAMAERGELPRFLAAVNRRFHTPHLAILLTSTLMAALTLSGTFLYAATISIIARLLIYASTCAALPVLRARAGTPSATFRAPAGIVASAGALLLIAWLLWNCTWREGRDTAIAAAFGLAIYALCRGAALTSTRR
jgi:APA family basic amino acid/polyamine antiporter